MSRPNPFAFNAPRGGAFKQLTKKPAHSSAVHKLAQRVVNTGKGSQSNRVSSSAHRAGRISLGNRPTPKFGPGGFTIGPRGRLKVNNGNFDGSYYGESGDEPGQKDGPDQIALPGHNPYGVTKGDLNDANYLWSKQRLLDELAAKQKRRAKNLEA
jgi:hypothetical protein